MLFLGDQMMSKWTENLTQQPRLNYEPFKMVSRVSWQLLKRICKRLLMKTTKSRNNTTWYGLDWIHQRNLSRTRPCIPHKRWILDPSTLEITKELERLALKVRVTKDNYSQFLETKFNRMNVSEVRNSYWNVCID